MSRHGPQAQGRTWGVGVAAQRAWCAAAAQTGARARSLGAPGRTWSEGGCRPGFWSKKSTSSPWEAAPCLRHAQQGRGATPGSTRQPGLRRRVPPSRALHLVPPVEPAGALSSARGAGQGCSHRRHQGGMSCKTLLCKDVETLVAWLHFLPCPKATE